MSDTLTFHSLLSWRGRVGPARPQFCKWLLSNAIPDPVVNIFRDGSLWRYRVDPAEDFADLRFNTESDIMVENRATPMALRDGLLIIGSLPNGDRIALDVREGVGAVGFIEHGGMWHSEDLRDNYIQVAASVDDMARLYQQGKLPADSCDAKYPH
jgi:hypothetical protein